MRTQAINYLGKVAIISILISFLLMAVSISPAGATQVREAGTGNGLHAEYFNLDGSIFKVNDQPLIKGNEGPIDHGLSYDCSNWTYYQGVCGLWADSISANGIGFQETLTGYIEAPKTGKYIFSGVVDDYLEITLQDQLNLFDKPYGGDYSFSADLQAGKFYQISMRFKNRDSAARLSFYWTLPEDGPTEIVPRIHLYAKVPNSPPIAEAGGPYKISEGSTVVLDASSSTDPDGNIVKYEWDLDNDTIYETSGITAQATFKENGTYSVGLKVTDSYDETSTDIADVIVSNVSPVVDTGLGITVNEGATFARNGSFTDPGADTWSATIDYGDGGGKGSLSLNADKTFALSHVYADNGNYPVQACVSDSDGGIGCASFTVTVANVVPNVQLASGATVDTTGVFTASGSFTDPGADIWTGSVNYGDGSDIQAFGLNIDKTFALKHTYTLTGTFAIEVCITDDDGGKGCVPIEAQFVPSNGNPPVADAGGPYFTWEDSKITLNAGKSTDPDNNIVSYEWDFNSDGNFDDATGKRVKYYAIDDGLYTVQVKVTDADGLSSIGNAAITVKNRRPVISRISMPRQVQVGTEVDASASFWDAGQNDTFTAIWDWGDGSTSDGEICGNCVSGSHFYNRPGFYFVKLRVEDNGGGVGYETKSVYVVRPRDWRHHHNHGEWNDD